MSTYAPYKVKFLVLEEREEIIDFDMGDDLFEQAKYALGPAKIVSIEPA